MTATCVILDIGGVLEITPETGCVQRWEERLVLPPGIAPSDDPLLSARSATYSESFTRREGETKTPSAVQVPAPGKGS